VPALLDFSGIYCYAMDQGPQRARVVRLVEEEFPGHDVIFDEDSKMKIRFRIEDRDGTRRSKASPHFHPSELEDQSDEELKSFLRRLCGLSA
jgi:hypothetical protein